VGFTQVTEHNEVADFPFSFAKDFGGEPGLIWFDWSLDWV
jgi:hypothetical protein